MKVVAAVGSVLHCTHAIEAARFVEAESLTLIVPNSIPIIAADQIRCFFDGISRLESALDLKVSLIFAPNSRTFWVQYVKSADLNLCADDRGRMGLIHNLMSLFLRRKVGLIEDGELAYCWRQLSKFAPSRNLLKRVLLCTLRINSDYGGNWSTSMIFVTDSVQFEIEGHPMIYSTARRQVVEIPNCFRLYEEFYPILEDHVRAEITAGGEAAQRLLAKKSIFLLLGGGPFSLEQLRSSLPSQDLLVIRHPASHTREVLPTGWEELPGSVPVESLILFLLHAGKDLRIFMVRSSAGRYVKQHFGGLADQTRLQVQDLVLASNEDAYFAGLHGLSRERQKIE